jgi:hypothetical protein
MAEAFIAEWDVLRLVIHAADDGWRVYAFETDEPGADQRTYRNIAYPTLESAKEGALQTATELLGWGLTANDLEWKAISGPLP